MKTYCMFVLLLSLSGCCTAQSTGSGNFSTDNVDEVETTVCINPLNVNNKTSTAIDNQTIALLYGKCLSICLVELKMNSSDDCVQNELHNYIQSGGFYWMNNLMDSSCYLVDQMFLCTEGCFIRTNISSVDLCTSTCLKSCEDNYLKTNISVCKRETCLLGCKAYEFYSDNNILDAAMPTTTAFRINETEHYGIYSIQFGKFEVEQSDLSGDDDDVFTVIFKITVLNDNKTIFVNKPGLIHQLNLVEYICHNINISYGWVSSTGEVSKYSPSQTLFVKGETVSQPLSVPYETIAKHYTYDDRLGYFGHFQVNISWTNPPDLISIAYYEIHVIHSMFSNRCRSAIHSPVPHFDMAQSSYIIKARDPSEPPFAGCLYDVKIVSVPVSSIFQSVNASSYLVVPPYAPTAPILQCSHFLNSEATFTVTINVTITRYMAFENILDSVSIIPQLIEYYDDKRVPDRDSFALIQKSIKLNTTNLVYNISEGFLQPKSTANYEYTFSVTLDWKYKLVFRPRVWANTCIINALSPQPTTITTFYFTQRVTRLSFSFIKIAVSWLPPLSMNGRFTMYKMCLLNKPLDSTQEVPSPPNCLLIKNVTQTFTEWKPGFIVHPDIHCFYLQIQAKNEYRAGNWSAPLTVPLDSQCNSTDFAVTSTESPSQTILPSKSTDTQEPTQILSSRSTDTQEPTQTTKAESQRALVLSSSFIAGGLFVMIFIVLIICIFCQLRRRKRRLELVQEDIFSDPIFRMGKPRFTLYSSEYNLSMDDWEIPASQVIIECELGQGEFGEVFKGTIADININPRVRALIKQCYSNHVAIKLLKPSATGNERRDFLQEIELMKKISEGNNPHVVNMIGCVTRQEPLCLITEFVKHGDLLGYLRANRKAFYEPGGQNPYPDLEDLQSIDLISFAYQIASGMEFLASLSIVHRDLACRNVLVGEGKILKITDFGMSRMVEGDVYVKTTKGRLPLKWMAIESIIDREFTSASDVWSYGITLWEIVTLGGFPYPTINNDELLVRLKQGYRMDCPENCSKEIYEIMLECWHEIPSKRPSFTVIRDKVDGLLSAQQCNAYIDLRTDEHSDIYNAQEDEENLETVVQRQSPSPIRFSKISLSSSPSIGSYQSADQDVLRVTNPWLREMSHSRGQHHQRSSVNLSPHLSHYSVSPRPQRPTSLALWDGPQENCYVDEPAKGPDIVIHVSSSLSSPQH